MSEYPSAPYLFRPNQDQFTRNTRIGYVLFTWTNLMERYVTATYGLVVLHVWIQDGYVPNTYPKYKLKCYMFINKIISFLVP